MSRKLNHPKGTGSKLRKFWGTHTPVMVIAFIFVSCFSLYFVSAAVYYNPSLPFQKIPKLTIPNANVSIESTSGETKFDMPNVLLDWTTPVSVLCTVTSTSISQNNPVQINASFIFNNLNLNVQIIGITIEPINALELEPFWYSPTTTYEVSNPPKFSHFPAWQVANDTFYQTWSGNDVVEFQDSGQISLKIAVWLMPTQELWNAVNWTTFKSDFNTTVTIPNILIKSQTAIQQQQTEQQQQIDELINNDRNLSLTYFVLFFAAIDIMVAVYDHSEDEDRKAEYHKGQAEKKYRNITEYS